MQGGQQRLMLKVNNLKKVYDNSQAVIALNNVSFELPSKGMIFITGQSGCGKTTLLNLLAGLDGKTEGEIYYDGKNVDSNTEKDWDNYRNIHMGMVFQEFNLFEDMTVEENISYSLYIQEPISKNKKQILEETLAIIEKLGLIEHKNKKVKELSGGQKQRVAIARALVKQPQIIIADEPTGNLDSTNSDNIFKTLKAISKECLVVIVTHNLEAAKTYGDRIITMVDGHIADDIDNAAYVTTYNIHKNDKEYSFNNINDIEKELANLIGDTDEIVIKVQRKPYQETNMDERYNLEKRDKKVSSLSFLNVLKLSFNNLKMRKARLLLTIFVFAITSFIFLSILSFTKNDYTKAVKDYFTNSEEKVLFVNEEIDKHYAYTTEKTAVYSGKNIYNKLKGLNLNIVKTIKEVSY